MLRNVMTRGRGRVVADRAARLLAVMLLFIASGTACGCVSTRLPQGRPWIGRDVLERTGHPLGPAACPGDVVIPPEVSLDDGLTADESVLLALWNNAAFQELLAELGIAQADLIQAGLLTNPDLLVLFPVGIKQAETTTSLPLEALWLRPKRVAAARLESRRVAERLVQGGLDLVRDARLAHAELLFAQDGAALADEAARLTGRIEELADARVEAGDASRLDSAAARLDALRAREQTARTVYDREIAAARLRAVTGLRDHAAPIAAVESSLPPRLKDDPQPLIDEAISTRPDARAADIAVAAAAERARVARGEFLAVAGVFDTNSRGEKGFEAGPGLRMTLPIFHQNDGAIARAEAELERARRRVVTIRDQIALDVGQAHALVAQAEQNLATIETSLLPAAEAAVRGGETAYREGETTVLLALETNRRLLELRAREVLLRADVRRSRAELERSMGRRLETIPEPVPIGLEVLP